nr:O-antigen ligase family protein [uncultured Flavobacterium sp.]
MGTIISFLAFLVIIVLALEYTFLNKTYFIKSPNDAKVKIAVSSRHRFILFLLASAFVQAGSFSATLLLVWIVLLLMLLFRYSTRFSDSNLFAFYAIYLIWLLFSLALSPEKEYGFRVFAKYLFPFLVVLVTSSIPINDTFFLKVLKVCFAVALFVNLIIIVPYIVPIGFITGPLFSPIIWWWPAIIDFNPFSMAIAIILYKLTKNKNYLFAIALFFLLPALASVRTGLIGLGVSLLAISFFKYKLRALPVFGFIIFGFIASVLFIPNVRDKMFGGTFKSAQEVINSLDILSFNNIDTSGRSAMWEWSLDTFYKGNELMGAGLGQLQARFYSGNHPFGSLEVIHNDYIQILCDTGQIGLILYFLILFSFVVQTFLIYNNKNNRESARNSAFIAGTSLCGIMACAFTDNVINYSLITLSYPYAFFGFALVLKKIKK